MQTPPSPNPIPFRDRWLTAEQAAEWLGLLGKDGKPSARAMMEKHRSGVITGFHLGHTTVRFLVRSVEAQLAHRAKLPKDVINTMNLE